LEALDVSENISDSVFLITQRQYDVSKNCILALDRAISLIKNKPVSFELLSIEVRDSLDAIDRILGKTTSEEILNNVFSNFCVGK
jgi:tRNA modification GTPase